MPHRKSAAIVLNCFDYSESSQIVHLLTPDHGKVNVIAKGIKKNRSYGVFDLFTYGDIVYLQKKESENDDLRILVELAIRSSFPRIRESLDRIYASLFAIEIVNASAQPGNADRETFELLLRFLNAMETRESSEIGSLVPIFSVHVLRLAGFLPRFSHCLRCDRPAQATPGRTYFLPGFGGYVCTDCHTNTDRGVWTRPSALSLLHRLGSSEASHREIAESDPPVRNDLNRVLFSSLEAMVDRHLKLIPYLTSRRGSSPDSI